MKVINSNKVILTALCVALLLISCKSKKNTVSSSSQHKQLTAYDMRKYDYLFFEGINAKIRGSYNEAVEKFLKCSVINPNEPAVYYEIGSLYYSSGKYNEGLYYAKKATDLSPENEWYQLLKANCYRGAGKYNDAIITYQDIIKNHPGRIDYYYDLAALYLYAVKPEEAVKTYDKIEEMLGPSPEIMEQKCRIYFKMGNEEKSDKEAEKLISTFPQETIYIQQLAQFYSDQGKKQKALDIYLKILKTDPENGAAHMALADFYREQNESEKSKEELRLAFKSKGFPIDNKMKILLQYYAYSENNKEYKQLANELCSLLIEAHPTDAKAYSIYGDYLYRDKKLSEARDAFRKAAELDKSKFPVWNQILVINNELNDFEAMVKDGSEVIELFPSEPYPYLYKGVGQTQLKKYNDAIATLKAGKEFIIDDARLKAEFFSNIADAYYKLKNYPESDKAFDIALELDPNNANIMNNYAYYLSLRNEQLDKAAQMADKCNKLVPNIPSYNDTYAWVLFKSGKYEEAGNWLLKAIENGGGTNSVILEHYGDVLYKQGDTFKAVTFWQEALKFGKGSEQLEKKINEKKYIE